MTINILEGIIAVICGVIIAKILEQLFPIRWKQLQDIILNWLDLK